MTTLKKLEEDLNNAEKKYYKMKDGYMKDLYYSVIKSLRISIDICKDLNQIKTGCIK